MNRLLLLFLLVFPFCLMAQPDGAFNKVDEIGRKQGPWRKNHENGKIRYEGTFVDNKPSGTFKYYYPSGKLKLVNVFEADGRTSRAVAYHENGKKMAEGKYVDEKKDSVWRYFDEKEALVSEETMVMNKKHGVSRTFFPKGQLCEYQEWKDDVKHGQWKQYFENGKIKSEGTYENGFWEGKLLRHHETGYKAAEGQYKKGVMEGDWMYYTNQGQPTFLEIYRNGVVKKSVYYNGEFEEKYPDDIPKWVYNYKNGKKHGAFREYYHQGSKKIQVKKGQDGYPDELKETYVGLQVRMEGNYSNDLLEGPVKYYKPDGKLEKTEIYKQGKLIETK